MNLPFSLTILSWKSPATLHQTLSSYKESGLLDLTDDVSIYFQEISDIDLAIAEEFNITKVYGDERNIGIGPAIKLLMEHSKHDVVMFLEDDWKLVENVSTTREIIKGVYDIVSLGFIDFYRLRSTEQYGLPLHTSQFAGREMDSPEHLIEQVHFLGLELATKFPEAVGYTHICGIDTVYTDSYYGNYSNNPFMCNKDFWLTHIAPSDNGGISLEGEIRKTWRDAEHVVGYNVPGLFMHNRIGR